MKAGLSERAMALAIGRTGVFVRSYESGKAALTVEELEQVAHVLRSTLGALIEEYESV